MFQLHESEQTRTWWYRRKRPLSRAEIVADGVVHGLGLLIALGFGTTLLVLSFFTAAPFPALLLYVVSLVMLLSVSLAYNIWPLTPAKRLLARLDQAGIFLFIAGSYTPFLAIMGNSPTTLVLTAIVWGASVVGIALKLILPHRFGRLAIALYLAIGWSGIFVFGGLAGTLPDATLWLLLAGGVVYSAGIIFHLWERLYFQTVLWHVFVVVGAVLHLIAIFEAMIFSRM